MPGFWFLDDDTYSPPAELVDFLAAGPPPVYVGFGSMTGNDPERLTRIALEAVARSGQRAVLLSGWAGLAAGDLPPNVLKLDSAPHGWLFPRTVSYTHLDVYKRQVWCCCRLVVYSRKSKRPARRWRRFRWKHRPPA